MKATTQRGAMARMRFTAAIGIGLAIGLATAGCASPPPADAPAQVRLEGRIVRPATGGGGGGAVVPVPAEAPSQSRPDFSGHWILDAKTSDDLREKASEAMQATRQVSGGGRGMGGGSGGGRGGGRQGRGASGGMGGGLPAGELAALLAPSAELHITHRDPMLLIADENDQRQRLFTDFRGASVSASGGLRQRVSIAGWEGAVLVVEAAMLGKKLTQGYHFDGTGRLVIASVAHVSETQPISYRLVYERVQPGAGVASR